MPPLVFGLEGLRRLSAVEDLLGLRVDELQLFAHALVVRILAVHLDQLGLAGASRWSAFKHVQTIAALARAVVDPQLSSPKSTHCDAANRCGVG